MTSTSPANPAAGGGRAWARTALAVAFWIAVWQVAAVAVGKDFLLASPAAVVVRLVGLVPTADFWVTVGFSLSRIGVGFVAAAIAGVALAMAAAASRTVETLAAPLIATIRSAPVVSFIILLLLWIDGGQLAAATSFLMALPVMYANVLEGIRRRDRQLLEMARVFEVPRRRRLVAIGIPAVAPFFVAASRSAIGLAWKAGIAAEVIGVASGSIGERLHEAKVFLESADLFAWTAAIVTLAVVCERLAVWALGFLPGARVPRAVAS